MKNKIRKIFSINLVLVLVISTIVIPDVTYAKTLGDLKKELQNTLNDYNEAQNNKNLTQSEIDSTQANISKTSEEITASQNEISTLTQEIEQLNLDIQTKKKQIKDIISFYQFSDSTTMYLDYAMGAKTFTDFIYRLAISEQLLQYNNDLIDQYNNLIVTNKKKQEDLSKKITELSSKQEQLKQSLDKLKSKYDDILDLNISIEEEIKNQREAISMYENQYGCKDSDDLNVCTRGQLPADTKFWRPLISGSRSSKYGWRFHPTRKVYTLHSGTDLVGSTEVYSTAAGVVAGIVRKSSCGGNMIFIHHKVNGVTYTSGYMHLRTIDVSVGDVVTKDTRIAITGGDPSVETWDKCSTGRHLHFMMAYGLYLSDYTSWSTFMSKTFDPYTMVNFPANGSYWSNRTTKY